MKNRSFILLFCLAFLTSISAQIPEMNLVIKKDWVVQTTGSKGIGNANEFDNPFMKSKLTLVGNGLFCSYFYKIRKVEEKSLFYVTPNGQLENNKRSQEILNEQRKSVESVSVYTGSEMAVEIPTNQFQLANGNILNITSSDDSVFSWKGTIIPTKFPHSIFFIEEENGNLLRWQQFEATSSMVSIAGFTETALGYFLLLNATVLEGADHHDAYLISLDKQLRENWHHYFKGESDLTMLFLDDLKIDEKTGSIAVTGHSNSQLTLDNRGNFTNFPHEMNIGNIFYQFVAVYNQNGKFEFAHSVDKTYGGRYTLHSYRDGKILLNNGFTEWYGMTPNSFVSLNSKELNANVQHSGFRYLESKTDQFGNMYVLFSRPASGKMNFQLEKWQLGF